MFIGRKTGMDENARHQNLSPSVLKMVDYIKSHLKEPITSRISLWLPATPNIMRWIFKRNRTFPF